MQACFLHVLLFFYFAQKNVKRANERQVLVVVAMLRRVFKLFLSMTLAKIEEIQDLTMELLEI